MNKLKILFISIVIILLGFASYAGYQVAFGGFTILDSDVVEIAFSENIASYNPYTFVETNDQRLRYIYEPLVKFDSDLNIKPSLVSSFGQLEPTVWEFKLKENIYFHDGTKLTAEMVRNSLARAKTLEAMEALTDTISTMKVVDEYTFIVNTTIVDSLFLSKLTHIYITPDGYTPDELIAAPIGTGQYKVKKIYPNELHLVAFENYHGALPKFKKLILSYLEDQIDRVNSMNTQKSLLIVHTVPVSFVDKIDQTKFTVKSTPNNAVNFFLFNFNRPLFKNLKKRTFLLSLFDDTTILRITDNQAKPTDQFVGSGVFGFNADILVDNFETEEDTIKASQRSGIIGAKVNIALSSDLPVFKEVIEQKLFKAGMLPTVNLLDPADLTNKDVIKNYDMIFMGWKSDSGDAVSFFENIAVTDGGLNLGNYSNRNLDKLVEQIKSETDEELRRDLLMQAMEIVSITDPIGVPVFEGVNIYGVNNSYEYTQRLDGFIDINNLKQI
jgi:peptide/nickel transport system substrate-binding protein